MSDVSVRVATLALAGLFAWAAGSKLLRWDDWRAALAGYRLPGAIEPAAAGATPVLELAIAAVLLSPAPRSGAALAVATLAAFSLIVLRGRSLQGDKLPCGCWGRSRQRDYRTMLARNALLGGLAAIVLLSRREASPLQGWSLPGLGEIVPVVLITIGVVAAAWMAYQVSVSARRGTRP